MDDTSNSVLSTTNDWGMVYTIKKSCIIHVWMNAMLFVICWMNLLNWTTYHSPSLDEIQQFCRVFSRSQTGWWFMYNQVLDEL